MSHQDAHHLLEETFRRIAIFEEIGSILHWDAATQMPGTGASARGDQLAELKLYRHGLLNDPRLLSALETAEGQMEGLSSCTL